MDHEQAFAEEAQEEAALTRRNITVRTDVNSRFKSGDSDESGFEDENSPLIESRRRSGRQSYSRARTSYERAIDEPWRGAHGSADLPWYKKPSILWLLPAFFPYCLAFGGIIVPKTYLVLDLICQDYLDDKAAKDPNFKILPVLLGEDNPQCRDPHVQSLVANFNLYANLLSGIFSAIMTPQYGALSDRIGRKPIIICASVGAFAGELITILVGKYPRSISVYWLLLGALVDGVCGSFTTGLAAAFAYAADTSAPERRNVAFGYFHGTLFGGIALGPIMAGLLMKATGTIMSAFYFALACNFFFIVFTGLVVPESLSKERQVVAREKRRVAKDQSSQKTWATKMREYNLFEPLWVLRPTGEGSSPNLRKNLFLLASIDTMLFGVAMGTMQILLIYAQFRFGWSPVDSSMYLSAVNICRVLGLVTILPVLTRIFRGKVQAQSGGHRGSDMLDINIIRGSILFDLVGYAGYAAAPTGVVMFIAGMIASLGGIGSPTLQSSLTKHMPADRTGQILGASGLLHALARVVSPTIFNFIYSKTVGTNASIVFICLASIFVVVFVLSWFLKPNIYFVDKSINLDVDVGDRDHDDEDRSS